MGDAPAPTPGDGEVLVDVRVASLGSWDLATLSGAFVGAGGRSSFPQVAGWDFSGETGDGRRVAGFVAQPWMGVGSFAQQLAVPASILADLPSELSFEEGSAVPVCALTAKLVLDTAAPADGACVLVCGAAGQVGGYIVELARLRGLRTIAAVHDGDRAAAEALGPDAVVSTDGDMTAAVLAEVAHGADACLDTVGLGAAALACVRDDGAFITTVPNAVPEPQRGISPGTVGVQPDAQALAELLRLAARGALTVRIAERVPLEQAVLAYERLAGGGLGGKMVLTVSP